MIIHLKKNIRLDVTLPIGPVSGFTSSALPLEFVDIPGEICGADVVAVAVTVTNADGVAATAPCEHADGIWRVIFAASCFEHYGYVESGVSVALTLRDGSGNERRMVLAVGDLEVKRSSPSAAPGDPEKSYQIKGEDIYVKTRVIDGVQHYARQEMSYDAEMGAWGADWLGDYILVDGEFVPFQAAGGTAATVATALLALLLVPFSAFGITATKEYVDRKDGEIAALSTNIVTTATNAVLDTARGYTDAAISQIPPPDFSTNNTALVETIEATAPAPGDYAAVSNAAVHAAITNALQDTAIESNRVNIATNRVAISALSDSKLDKSGGTMTGNLIMGASPLTIGRVDITGGSENNEVLFVDEYGNTAHLFVSNDQTVAYTSQLPTVPTNVSAFNNDAGYLTGYTETDPTISSWAKAASKPTYTASEVGATTPADVTAAIREQSLGGIWDAELEVWWTPRMRNGNLTYEATTNVNLNAVN